MMASGFRARSFGVLFVFSVVGACTCSKKGNNNNITGDYGVPNPSAMSIDFGNVPVGQHVRKNLNLSNSGAGPLTLQGGDAGNGQAITGDTSNAFSEPQPFKPDVSSTAEGATLQFAPTQAGPVTATLQITSDGDPSSLPIALTGVGVNIDVSSAPSSIDFGGIQLGVSSTQSVTFTNNASAASVIFIDSTATDPQFTVIDPATGPISATTAIPLGASGGTYSVNVTYTPTVVGSASSSFSFTACTDSTQSTCIAPIPEALNGVGINPAIIITPNPIGFTGVPGGQSLAQTVTITNTGTNAATLNCLALQNAGYQCGVGTKTFDFGNISPGAPACLAPVGFDGGSACVNTVTFPLTYTASAAGNDNDVLSVQFTPLTATQGQDAGAPIIGDGVLSSCTLTIAPSSINFGTVTINNPITKSATLTNSGGSQCNVTGIVLDPSSDKSYTLASGQASTLSIPPGGNATIGATFDLAASGTPNTRSGVVDYASNDPSHATGTINLIASLNANNPYANGWPKWHYDNNNSGQTIADTSALTGTIAWKFTGLTSAQSLNNGFGGGANCGGEAYVNSPVVADNQSGTGYSIYQVSLDGNLYAFDQSGNTLWKTMLSDPTGDPHPSTPAVTKTGNIWAISGSDSQSLFGTNPKSLFYLSSNGSINFSEVYGEDGFDACPGLGPDGTLFESDDDGEVGNSSSQDPYSAMAFTANGSSVTPAGGVSFPLTTESERFGIAIANDDTSYWGNNGQFFAVSAPSQGFKLLSGWPAKGVTLATAPGSAVGPVYSDVALDPVNTGFMYAYSAWETATGKRSQTFSVQGNLVALSLTTGATQWTVNLPATALPSGWTQLCSDVGNAAPAVANDGTVYVGNGDGLRAIDGPTGKVKWLFSSANVSSAPAIGSDGTVFFGCSDGSFYAVKADGTLRFKLNVGAPVSSSPAIADDGSVFFTADNGTLYAVH